LAEEERARTAAEERRLAEEEKARIAAEERRLAEEEKARTEAEQRRLVEEEKAVEPEQLFTLSVAQERQQQEHMRWRTAVIAVLQASLLRELVVAPDISVSLISRVRDACGVPESESVIGVLEWPAEEIVFGVRGLYLRTAAIDYVKLPDDEYGITLGGGGRLSFLTAGTEVVIDLRRSSLSVWSVGQLLIKIKRAIRDACLARAADA
jgi:hypothetical protein